MRTDLKKAIIDFMFENEKDFQLANNTIDKFRQYIYTEKGDYCLGGSDVSEFIIQAERLIKF